MPRGVPLEAEAFEFGMGAEELDGLRVRREGELGAAMQPQAGRGHAAQGREVGHRGSAERF